MANPAFPWTPKREPRGVDATELNRDYDAEGLMEVSALLNQGAHFLKQLERAGRLYDPWYVDRLGHYERFLYETARLINETRKRHGAKSKREWPFTQRKPRAKKAPGAGNPLKKRAARKDISPRVRFSVLRKAGFRCVYCGTTATEVALQIDHVHPVALGGTNTEDNLVAACRECNAGKGTLVGVEPPA